MEFLFRLGARWRNPSLFSRFAMLKESERWSREQLVNYQIAQCRSLLELAQGRSPYYREVFRKAQFEPADFRSLQDLQRLPVIEKSTLIRNNADIHTNVRLGKLFRCETSGTSGQVLTFLRDEEWDSGNRAAVMRGYSWFDVNPWDRSVYLWGFNTSPLKKAKVRILDVLQNRFRVFTYDEAEIKRLARHTRTAVVLHGYSSMIYNIAKILNKDGQLPRPERLKLVKGTSEKIFESYQDEARKAFGMRIVSEYGAAETGLIAFECPHGSMHIHMEGCHVEVVDGEAVVTNLLSRSFPVIRYRLADSIELAPDGFECPCGMKHTVIREVLGRVGSVVHGKTGQFPSLAFYYVFKNLFFEKGLSLSYQAQQHEKGKVVIDVEQDCPEHLGVVQAEIRKYFSDDLDATIRFGKKIESGQKKRRDFISHLA